MIYTEEMVNNALAFAKIAHTGQKYSDHDYFDFHIKGVVKILTDMGATRLCRIVGALHDVREDTGVSQDLIKSIFSEEVKDLVEIITKQVGEPYFEYIARVKESPVCRQVKMADSLFNYGQSVVIKDLYKIDKYSRAIWKLMKE